jgi:hypothetical protein
MAILTTPDLVRMGARTVDGIDNVQGRRLNTVIWILAALSTIFLALRLYAKLYRNRKFWWDDHFLVASYVRLTGRNCPTFHSSNLQVHPGLTFPSGTKAAFLVSIILQSVCVHYGLGLHDSQIPSENVFPLSKASYASGFCSIISLAWSKTSFSLTLLRITSGWTKWVVWFTIVTVNLVLGVNAAFQWLRCWPIAKAWDWNLEGTCVNESVVEVYQTFAAGRLARGLPP